MRILPVLAAVIVICVACEQAPEPATPAVPAPVVAKAAPMNLRLPTGTAGPILQHAIDGAGGWQQWTAMHDVAFVTTFTIFDAGGNVTSESIGLHKSPLHVGPRVRFESLGVPEPVVLGFDGKDAWMMRDGSPVPDSPRLVLSRFNMVSNIFWFSLPFSLAELPVTVTDLGAADDKTPWQRLKVTLADNAPEAPGDWFVFYLHPQTGLIDHVFAHITAPFLNHNLWVGKWLDYRDCDGIKKERRRQFFPADADGTIIGNMVVEQLVEDVRFNNHFTADLFVKPLAAGGGKAT